MGSADTVHRGREFGDRQQPDRECDSAQCDRKKNFLFIGHSEAGERSAVIYTLLGSCRRHGVNPFDYLRDLFTRLPAAKITQIKEFTPRAWAKAKEQMVAQAA